MQQEVKKEYSAPEMEIIDLQYQSELLSESCEQLDVHCGNFD